MISRFSWKILTRLKSAFVLEKFATVEGGGRLTAEGGSCWLLPMVDGGRWQLLVVAGD